MKTLKSILGIKRGIAVAVANEIDYCEQTHVHKWARLGDRVDSNGAIWKRTSERRTWQNKPVVSITLKEHYDNHAAYRTWILSTLDSEKEVQVWQHMKSAAFYQVLHLTNTGGVPSYRNIQKFVPTVVYKSLTTGDVWSRPLSEFVEKFQPENIFYA